MRCTERAIVIGGALLVASACAAARVATVVSTGPADSRPASVAATRAGTATSTTAPATAINATTAAVVPAAPPDPAATTTVADGANTASNATAAAASTADESTAPTDATVAQSVSPTSVAGPGPEQAKRAFTRFGFPLTDGDASCVAGAIDAGVLAKIDRADLDVPTDDELVAVVTALARCEPPSYVNEQIESLVGSYGITAEQGQCVTKAADRLAAGNDKVAAVMLDDWARLEQPWRDKLLAVVTPCVGDATARTIVSS